VGSKYGVACDGFVVVVTGDFFAAVDFVLATVVVVELGVGVTTGGGGV
jgi:hypothetical protein